MWAENRFGASSSSGESSAPATNASPSAYDAGRQNGGAYPAA